MVIDNRLEIETAKYEEFLELWRKGIFEQQRLGQAFYNHMNLHRLTNQSPLHALYEADGEKALKLVKDLFLIR